MPNYDLHQQIFALSLASNIVNNLKDTTENLQKAMYSKLIDVIKTHLGDDWKIGWGPVVWKEDPEDTKDGPGNSWFIGHNPALKFEDGSTYDTYVVSIAGTASMYDWLNENFGVNYVVDFTAWINTGIQKPPQKQKGDHKGTYIAYGTAGGVYNLVTNPVPSGPTGVGKGTIIDFLSSLLPTGTKVIFTGVSLGGALSPTLALAVLKSGVIKNFRQQDVLTYPVAGPTPGNDKFAQEYATNFPFYDGLQYRCWNANIVNLLDVVPQAWCDNSLISPQQNIDNILSIWGLPTLFAVALAVIAMHLRVAASFITYIPLPSRTFRGEPPGTPKTIAEWFTAAGKEHEIEYEKYIDVLVGFKFIVRDPLREGIADN